MWLLISILSQILVFAVPANGFYIWCPFLCKTSKPLSLTAITHGNHAGMLYKQCLKIRYHSLYRHESVDCNLFGHDTIQAFFSTHFLICYCYLHLYFCFIKGLFSYFISFFHSFTVFIFLIAMFGLAKFIPYYYSFPKRRPLRSLVRSLHTLLLCFHAKATDICSFLPPNVPSYQHLILSLSFNY